MKTYRIILYYLVTITFLVCIAISCGNRKKSTRDSTSELPAEPTVESATYFDAIDRYLSKEIASSYAPGEISIPFHTFVSVDETNADDILVWGDFWVMNYDQVGDTLKCVSGGSHPGKMHVRQTDDGEFEVTSFEQVGDGSSFLPTAKAIFSEKFDDFMESNSNEVKREEIRKSVLAAYVSRHRIPVKYYQDFGWPAVPIPDLNLENQ